ncbi:acetyl-CoA carboxylase biotin carboxyl carrier protein [Leptothrix discophora]|uniref:Biotin carboxyl carrier protein of acetyl-CoA carboxylase n=1 Tax=Leptothrix discophora TaxID=89 RepID=A0ABT9G5E7_LEPDI|nr:acetyl-CoA carboxylase biotin carboxyl carrier protein [Leptothrix discophora]MDP4301704.1 acetyl-CoA carboxylase biotin carboxyl carrier protein [Leptothrix discophora]
MDLRKLKTLIDLVSESNVSELEITEAEGKVRIVKAPPTVIQAAAAPVMVAAAPALAAAPAPAQVAAAVPLEAAAPAVTGHMVKSPMVGTFYRASNPGAKPLADVGQQVKEGQALCIIEAMKIMNEIDSDKAGVITKVLVENGQPVEYGQPLFIIE